MNRTTCSCQSISPVAQARTVCRLWALIAGIFALAGSAAAQQFVQETSTRFPNPNPTDYSNQLTIGDIDNDGDLDLIFANGGGFSSEGPNEQVRVFVNNGTGFFTDESVARTNSETGNYRGVELGDIDNDGDLDMILAQDFHHLPILMLNDGTGHFTDGTHFRIPVVLLASSRAQFGDVDNDGDLDLFITSGVNSRFDCGQYRLYLNDGTGFFSDATTTNFPIGTVCENMDCIFGDIDNDFDIDIRAAGRGSNTSRLYVNDGTGVYTISTSIPADSTCYSYDFGDMDGDGDLDLLGANGGSGTSEILLKNDGTGAFTNASSQLLSNPSIDDNDSKFFDYDNDGDMDLIIGALGGSSERIYNNNGSGVFSATSGVISAQSDSTLDIMVADLTGDGALDIVTAQGESGNFQNRIYRNTGPADTIPPTIVSTEQQPDTTDTTGPYVIRALILDQMSSDRNFFDHGIFLNYQVNGGAVQQATMRYSGGQVYRGEIPGQLAVSTVAYWVTAIDFNDNSADGPTLMFMVNAPAECGVLSYEDLADCMSGPCDSPPCNPAIYSDACCALIDADVDGDTDLLDFAEYTRQGGM